MIVKISTALGWRFIDDIDDIFVYQDSVENIITQTNDCPTEWMNEDKNLPEGLDKIYKVVKLIKNETLSKRIVIKNNTMYLLNDEGKTIERLN